MGSGAMPWVSLPEGGREGCPGLTFLVASFELRLGFRFFGDVLECDERSSPPWESSSNTLDSSAIFSGDRSLGFLLLLRFVAALAPWFSVTLVPLARRMSGFLECDLDPCWITGLCMSEGLIPPLALVVEPASGREDAIAAALCTSSPGEGARYSGPDPPRSMAAPTDGIKVRPISSPWNAADRGTWDPTSMTALPILARGSGPCCVLSTWPTPERNGNPDIGAPDSESVGLPVRGTFKFELGLDVPAVPTRGGGPLSPA
mmetsp:Transcript_15860/g.31832  ORF Transcript_15860/g.31832 Transcript_15860/m.31832 type:complete len:260 (-) Transcript_15860:120-899(-)